MVTNRTASLPVVLGGILLSAGLLWWLFGGSGSQPGTENSGASVDPSGDGVTGTVTAPAPDAALREKIVAAETPDTGGESQTGGSTGALRIRVIDGTNDKPVPGVGVIVREVPRDGAARAPELWRADAKGEVLVEGLQPGRASVATDRAGMGWTVLEVVAGTVTNVTITLKGGVALRGVVVDEQGGPVSGATILLGGWGVEDPTAIARADENGRFAVRPVPPRCHVAARAKGYSPSYSYTVNAGSGAEVEVRIVLSGVGGGVAGRVLAPDGSGVADAVVRIGKENVAARITMPDGTVGMPPPRPQVRTDTIGRFKLEGLKPGVAVVTVKSSTCAPWTGQVEVIAHQTALLKIRLSRGVTVTGAVRDGEGNPLSGVAVRHGEYRALDHRRVRTARDGSYSLLGLPASQPLTVRVRHQKFGDAAKELQGADGTTQRCDFVLSRGRVLTGRVLGQGGAPLADARVYAEEPPTKGRNRWYRDAKTDAAGKFEITGCPSGPVIWVVVQAKHYVQLERRSIDASNSPIVLQMRYEGAATARIVGRLVDPDGQPVKNATIHVGRDGGGGGISYSTNTEGEIRIEKLRPGLCTVRIQAGKFARFVSEERAIRSDELWDLGTVQLQRGGRLRVDLERPSGGVGEKERIFVSVYRGGLWLMGIGSRKTVLESHPFPPGEYSLRVWGPRVMETRTPFVIRDGEWTEVRARPVLGVGCRFALTLPDTAAGKVMVYYEIDGADGYANRGRLARRASDPIHFETGLAPGSYTIRVRFGAYSARREFQVRAGDEPRTIPLDLK